VTRRRGGAAWLGAAALLFATPATVAAAAPRLSQPVLGGSAVLPAQGTKVPVEAPPQPEKAEPEPVLPPNARLGTAQINTGSTPLNFPNSPVSLPGAAVAEARSSPMARPRESTAAPGTARLDDAPSAAAGRAGAGALPGGRDRRRFEEPDAGPPDTPLPAGARFGSGQISFPDTGIRFADARLASGSASVADPRAVALPGGMAMREEGRGLRVTLDADVLFDFDRAELRPEAGPRLQRLMQEVSARIPRPAFRVEGHTDSIGSDAYNLRLSTRRAESVRNWLVQAGGVPRAAVSTAGYGESRPVAPNSTPDGRDDPEGRQRNRRVELVVTPR
jgi:outer membrane protein OmpA-like peptidoglycan-associated protein